MISKPLRFTASMLVALLALSVTTPAQVRRRSTRAVAPRKNSDWAFPSQGMKPVSVEGRSVYLLGNGFAAIAPKRSNDGGQHVLVVISENAAEEFNRLETEKDYPPGELLANGVFYKVCKPSAEKPAFLGTQERALQLSPDTIVTHYLFRTSSGATARIQLAKDGQTALVMLPPSEHNAASSKDVERRPTAKRSAAPTTYTFEELRRIYLYKEKADVLRDLGKPFSTYDAGERVAWTYRNLAYDPILGRYKNVSIWFDKYGFVDLISE
jgi:hypothetical protein